MEQETTPRSKMNPMSGESSRSVFQHAAPSRATSRMNLNASIESKKLTRSTSNVSEASILPPAPFPPPQERFRTSETVTPTFVLPKAGKHNSLAVCNFNGEMTTLRSSTGTITMRRSVIPKQHALATPPMPDVLVFTGWHREGHASHWKDVIHMRVEFETDSGVCTVVMDGTPMVVEVVIGGKPVEVWDLHVGAILNVLGRRLELRKAHLATQMWLDNQAQRMLRDKSLIESELRKFGYVQFRKDYENHINPNHLPRHLTTTKDLNPFEVRGGRINLRRLATQVEELLMELRKFRKSIPTHSNRPISPKITGPAWAEGSVPDLWNVALQKDPSLVLEKTPSLDERPDSKSVNYYAWLKTIPLASTAAGISAMSPEPEDLIFDGTLTASAHTKAYIRAVDQHSPKKAFINKGNESNPFKSMVSK